MVTGPRRPHGVGPEWMPRRRWRAGVRVYTDVTLGAAFLVVGVAPFVAPLVGPAQRPPVWGLILFTAFGVFGLVYLADSVNGLRAVRVDGDPPALSVPTFSLRRGYRRRRLPLTDIVEVGFSGSHGGARMPYVRARFVTGDGEVQSDSITRFRDRREDATRAGRALADIRTLVEWNRPW